MKLECTENCWCETWLTTTATIHKAYDALGFVVLGGEGGERHKFFKTHVITHQDIFEMIAFEDT